MTRSTRVLIGIILLTVPTIEFGGYFLLNVLSDTAEGVDLTAFQQSMFRAGHAHAGVLVILSIIALILSDHAQLPKPFLWFVKLGFPMAATLVSGGFFAAAIGEGLNQPNHLIIILYIGASLLAICLVVLGIGLVRKKD